MLNSLPLVSIVILNWNRSTALVAAVNSAKKQTYQNLEIIVVDNASTDDSVNILEKKFPEITLIKLDKNYGCPGGRNRSVDYVNGDLIFFLDNDGILEKDSIKNAVDTILKNEKFTIVSGSVIDNRDNPNNDSNFQIISHLKHGGVSLHKKDIFLKAGGYPDDYMYGGEEGFLSLKVLELGYFIVYCSKVILYHKKSLSSRDQIGELINRQTNALMNQLLLWPFEYIILFVLKSMIKFPYQAIKYGYFHLWCKLYFRALLKRIKSNKIKRIPVSRKTIYLFIELQRHKYYDTNSIPRIKFKFYYILLYLLYF